MDVAPLEKTQRRASRLALGQRRSKMTYEECLKRLNWPTLESCRLYLSLLECYKIVLGLNNLKFNDFFELTITKYNSARANHSFQLSVSLQFMRTYVTYLLANLYICQPI